MSWQVIEGDCRDVLAGLPERSVQTCVTSPPYFGLRDYGTGSWQGGDVFCEHKAGAQQSAASTLAGNGHGAGKPLSPALQAQAVPYRDVCGRCGATRVDRQIGLEPTPDEFVAALVGVFREVRRVLADDGTVWLNLGDSYSGSGPSGASYESATTKRRAEGNGQDGAFRVSPTLGARGLSYADKKPIPAAGTKPKDLIGIPWMVAFALRADGWYLRSDVIWHKPNPMPESVTDRPTKAHEYLFLLSKGPRYFYDGDAIAEEATNRNPGNVSHKHTAAYESGDEFSRTKEGLLAIGARETRNRRSVWTVPSAPFAGAHFATFPPKLIEPCVLAGSRPGDVVLDPFNGAGTTGLVALRHDRCYVGIELNPEYAAMARDRIRDDAPLLNTPLETV